MLAVIQGCSSVSDALKQIMNNKKKSIQQIGFMDFIPTNLRFIPPCLLYELSYDLNLVQPAPADLPHCRQAGKKQASVYFS